MGFFKRLFSGDYRAAVSAEAAGDFDLAAQRYALAGEHESAARMHILVAERAESNRDEIESLRDAVHWAPDGGATWKPARSALGKAILARARSEGIATERDRKRVREAAGFLAAAGEWLAAGQAWELVGADQQAADAYSQGGLVDRLEAVLARDGKRAAADRSLREASANYELHMRGGDRDAARACLNTCLEVADKKAEYRRLLDELESRLIGSGFLVLRPRGRARVIVCGKAQILMGRDPLCELVLRSPGVSRNHARVELSGAPRSFELRDEGSRNGTLIGGMPIAGAVPLVDCGSFALGEVYELDYQVVGDPAQLVLRIVKGMDEGVLVLAGGEGEPISLAAAELAAEIRFERGRPLLTGAAAATLELNGEVAAHGATQLIHGDQLELAGVAVEVV